MRSDLFTPTWSLIPVFKNRWQCFVNEQHIFVYIPSLDTCGQRQNPWSHSWSCGQQNENHALVSTGCKSRIKSINEICGCLSYHPKHPGRKFEEVPKRCISFQVNLDYSCAVLYHFKDIWMAFGWVRACHLFGDGWDSQACETEESGAWVPLWK